MSASAWSVAMRRKWQDPEYRAKQADARRRGKSKLAAAIKRKWQDPEYRAKQAKAKRPYQRKCAERQAKAAAERAAAKQAQAQAKRELIEKHRRLWAQSPHGKLDCRADYKARNAFICAARADGLTLQETADIYGLTRQRIKQIANQHDRRANP